ncbi:hypothetical protein [Methylocystis heyeri]|uniref:Uncharacterized protein n=1 Tax=Methylocystis heyeri TaxID=391905 RepID=A0A6B8KKS2_9HYPH|nr:hypothetical protein [Methylocystis heyeri]QGM48237.1 hypothetical protein H2LOC_020840 [Methylocystis heyeri]
MLRSPKRGSKPADRVRADGRRSHPVCLDAQLIKNLKKAAPDDERNAYEIVEEATRAWLAKRARKRQATR